MEINFSGGGKFLIKSKGVKVMVEDQEIKIETEEETVAIKGPGEYEVKEVAVLGIGADAGKTIYVLSLDSSRVAYLGKMETKLTDGQLNLLEGVDVLLVSVGGLETVKQISPAIVVPMNYANQAELDGFIKAMGVEPRKEAKLIVSKLDLKEETELVILEVKK